MSQNQQKPPSIFKMMRTFTKELAEYIKQGAPNVTSESYAKRLDICSGCEHLIKESMRCGSCGCLLEHKAKWKTTTCPEKKWPEEDIPQSQKDDIDRREQRAKLARKEDADWKGRIGASQHINPDEKK